MPWSIDARVGVRLGTAAAAREGDALLVEGQLAATGAAVERFEVAVGHAAGCACCLPRSAAAAALDRLFQARARGAVPFFRQVLAVTATEAGDMAVFEALRTDPLVSARFRLDG